MQRWRSVKQSDVLQVLVAVWSKAYAPALDLRADASASVAARVESATRETGDTILISEHTRRLLTDERVSLNERPAVPLKGKSEPITLFAPAAQDDAAEEA